MKTLMLLPVLALGLAGCASQPQYAARQGNPYEWQTVSVTPVPAGTAARSGAPVNYSSEPQYGYQQPVYAAPQPVYVQPAPVYMAPAPVYAYPPVSIGIGLDFIWSSHHWRGGRGRGR